MSVLHRQPHRQSEAESGFTLVEMLVALLIFGLISAAAVSLLTFSVRAQEVAGIRLSGLADLRRASAMLGADLAQAAPRFSRDEAGAVHPAFAGGTGEDGGPALALVRHGWSNVDRSPRPLLQKVEYRLNGSSLERRSFPQVDGAEASVPLRLIDGVSALRLRYRDPAGAWRDRWDPVDPAALPVAAEAVFVLADGTEVRQLFLVGAGA